MKKNKLSNLIILILILTIILLFSISLFYKYELKSNLYKDAIIVNKLGKIRGSIQRYVKLELVKNKKSFTVKNYIDNLFKKVILELKKDNLILYKCKKEFLEQLNQLDYTWKEIQRSNNIQRSIILSEIAWKESNNLINYFEHIHKLKFNNLIKNMNLFIYISILFLIFITIIVYLKIQKGLEINIITDKLTNLYNRPFFDKQYEYLISKYERNKIPFSMIIIDIDNFKKINDTYGHKKGDWALKEIGKIIKDSIRKTDLAFRYGGEEIVVLLPDTPLKEAKFIADRIRIKISETIKINDNPITISAGVGEYNGENMQEFFKKVDKALYLAKKTGKNRIIIS